MEVPPGEKYKTREKEREGEEKQEEKENEKNEIFNENNDASTIVITSTAS